MPIIPKHIGDEYYDEFLHGKINQTRKTGIHSK